MKTYPALVLAGFSPDKPDPLALAMGGERKALLDVAGKPMIYWVVQALQQSQRVHRVAVVGLNEGEVQFDKEILFVPNQNSHFDNIIAGIKAIQQAERQSEFLVIASADIPLLHAKTVDWFVESAERTGADFIYTIVEKGIMEGQYPGAARSYVPMPEGRFCGGDLHFVRMVIARNNEALVRGLSRTAKERPPTSAIGRDRNRDQVPIPPAHHS